MTTRLSCMTLLLALALGGCATLDHSTDIASAMPVPATLTTQASTGDGFVLPLTVYTLTSFMNDMPWELEEAARIDGATRAQAFRLIVLPLEKLAMEMVSVPSPSHSVMMIGVCGSNV